MMEPADNKYASNYFWAMKGSFIREDESYEWRQRKSRYLLDHIRLEERSIVRMAQMDYILPSLTEEGLVRIMASMVPDEILYNIDDYSKREFDACLLFGDVSVDNKRGTDYHWAMKASFLKPERNTDWKNKTENSQLIRSIPTGKLLDRTILDNFNATEEGLVKIMASLVPDEILYNINDYSKREFDACLLFGDVSGFTELCEKYNKTGKGGPSRLTQVLNSYIGAMVQEILSHSGDVLKFSGDAFIALFKETDRLSLRNAVHEAIDCSLVIQKTYGNYQSDVDVIIRVKLAISCGHLVFSLIGDQTNSHYIMTGQPIIDIKAAETKSYAGDIVISLRVSHHVSANEYLIDMLPDGNFAKILGVGPNWRNIQRHYDHKNERFSITSSDQVADSPTGSLEDLESVVDDSRLAIRTVNDQYALRPAVNYACRMKYKDVLRKFIIGPVMRGIDAEEPLEYLTEIRQVAILFINVKVEGDVTPYEGIDVAHEVYVTVCTVVKNNYGCVNKISNFDKDLMLLVIFGLRGYKHELESQIALRCAKDCRDRLMKMPHIAEVAAGVTCGKTYCGAFGHTLRREYTVIGLVVNKAARLMMAYPMKVTCDRETFLHSKLESRNFILQEYKPLKGIVNPGPIYEFKLSPKSQYRSLTVNPLPLLGREQELDLFKTLFNQALKFSSERQDDRFVNMLIMKGAYRQGKTRLIDEISFTSREDVPKNRFTVTRHDYDIPYRTIRFIFSSQDETTDTRSTMNKISAKLNDPKIRNFLCLFNAVFEVNFPITQEYLKLDQKQKYEALQKLFRVYVKSYFDTFWLVAIDDSEYVDDESWMLIDILLESNNIFMVTTMGIEKELSTFAIRVLKNPRIKAIELKGIDKWYHVGLACQMMQVDGVPPELEKTIQLKSNGNPGWVESFLVSLRQSGGIKFTQIPRITAFKYGIVIAPLYMLLRLSKEETNLWMQVMEEENAFKNHRTVNTRWKMFVDSCRESFPNLTVSKLFAEKLKKADMVNIATIRESFNLDDVDPEQVIDVIILKTFDALTSYEQLLLKCSAILGDIFPRDMLLYIMSSSAQRLTALAVKKLFEIRVLSCARGNFLEGGLVFKERLTDPNEDMIIQCDCIGLIIEETCLDLPKYASCGYLRFRSSEFRETTYNLLTDNQKREFHEKAIRYLEKETRRCRACGNGYFGRQIGNTKVDHGLRSKTSSHKRRKSSETGVSGADLLLGSKFRRASYVSFESLTSNKSKDYFRQRETVSIFSNPLSSEILSLQESSKDFTTTDFGFLSINKLKDNYNLTRTFSSTDYSQCKCMWVLTSMFQKLIEHCKGASLGEKILNATVDYAYVCIETENIPQAIKVLEEALILLDGPIKDQIELDWMVELQKGKLYALLGRARMEINPSEGYEYLITALKCYDLRFPITNVGKKLKKWRWKIAQIFKFYLNSQLMLDRRTDDDVAEYSNNVSECLNFLCSYFMSKKKWMEAELAAIWSLSKVLKTETDFEKLCIAYASLIKISAILGRSTFTIALEVFALKMCHYKKVNIELEDLRAVAYLYASISKARIRRAELEKFLHIGYLSWRLATSSQKEILVFEILPLLAHGIILKKQVIEYGNMLQEMLYIVEHDKDNSIMAWYYALGLQFIIETGIPISSYARVLKFMQNEGLEPTIRDPDGKERLAICIWLWEVRMQNWDAAKLCQRKAWRFKFSPGHASVNNLITACYLLEGLIIYMVAKMDMKNLKEFRKADKLIQKLFKDLHKAEKNCRIITPRLCHLRAYYTISKFNNYQGGLNILKKAQKMADKHANDLELTWTKHSELAWLHKLTREQSEGWNIHADEDALMDFRDTDILEKFIQYSLPLPLYI